MNRILLTCLCMVCIVAFGNIKSLACSCQDPVAGMSIEPSTYDPYEGKYYICRGKSVTFDASASYDPDCEEECDCEDTLDGIRKFEWDWTNDGSYDDYEEPGDGIETYTYMATGSYTVKLKVTDDDNDCCCSGTDCKDSNDTWTADIVVVDIEKIVEEGTSDEGPLYVSKDGEIDLEAKSDPDGAMWPYGSAVWSVNGPGQATLSPETHSETTTLSGFTKAGEYTVMAKCCDCAGASLDWITVYALEIRSQTESTVPTNRDRTTLGLGEKVECWVYPDASANWSVDNGSVTPGPSIYADFSAMKSPSTSIVSATVGDVTCQLSFEIIAPDGLEYEDDIGPSEDYPPSGGNGTNFVGSGREFPIIIKPTTVSFHELEFQENIPVHNWQWPNLTSESFGPHTPDFTVSYGNTGATDEVQQPPRPYGYLHDGSQYIPFDFTIGVPVEYKDEYGSWVEFISITENTHKAMYTASGTCYWIVTADNQKESDPEGPWENDTKEE